MILNRLLVLVVGATGALARSKHGINRLKHAHDAAAAEARLKQISAANKAAFAGLAAMSTSAPESASLVLADASVSMQIYTSDIAPDDAPAACVTALVASVACNSTILDLGEDYTEFSDAEMDLMCSSTCQSALEMYRSSVKSACGSYMITDVDGSLYPPTVAADTVLSAYTLSCEKDSKTGQYCTDVVLGFGDVPAQGVLAWPTSDICTPCFMGNLNLTVSNPVSYNIDAYNALQSALKTCGSAFATYNVTQIPSPTDVSIPGPSQTPLGSNTTSSSSCALIGRNVTTSANTTCDALGQQFSITGYDVLNSNPTLSNSNCTDGILPGSKLCIPQACTLFTASANQTCTDVVKAVNQGNLAGGQNITKVQLTSWNPFLEYACLTWTDLDDTVMCITPHGGWPAVDASSGNGESPAATPTAIVPPPGPTVSGTTANCGQWAFVGNGTNCQQLILGSAVTFDDFRRLNPEVDENCFNLWASYYYCVAPYPPFSAIQTGPTVTVGQTDIIMSSMAIPSATDTAVIATMTFDPTYDTPPPNLAAGTITYGCSYYYNVASGDTCDSISTAWGMNLSIFEFYNQNPNAICPSLTADSAVCLLVINATAAALGMGPANKAAGSAPYGCTTWYTIVKGDDCGTVETKFKLSAAQFFALNPEVKTDCSNLGLGAAYCVGAPPDGIIPSSTSTTGPTSTSSTPTSTPTVAAGSWTNCTSYYQVQANDNCNIIESKYSISFSDFLKWNPEIKSDCSNLDIQRYCVAGSPAACGKTYTVVSGDFCSLVESKTGVSDSTLRSLNPWLDASCDMQIGQNLCIAPPPAKPTNIASGSWTNCTTYYQVVSNDNCNKIEQTYGISFTDLLRWNSGLNTACSNLALNSYCVAGSPASCGKTYTVVSGDFCSLVESKNSISDGTLRSLNPWLDANCDLQIGQNVCVAPAGSGGTTTTSKTTTTTTSTTSTTTSKTTTSGSSKPTNIASGSWTNCTSYYQVVSGDNCNIIESKNSISFTDLLKWNSGVNTACSNLGLNSYCVKGSPSACKQTYQVVSGDFCFSIYNKFGLTEAQFRTLNPWLDSGCDVSVGQFMCVA